MNAITEFCLSRRSVLAGSGALVVSFSLLSRALAQGAAAPQEPVAAPEPPKLPGALDSDRFLDSWIRIDADGTITVFTGKVELGQGAKTALTQIAAEELGVEMADINLITADTGQTPNEGFTAGSQTMQNSGTAIRNAAAQVRELLIAEAARRSGASPDMLHAENKAIIGSEGIAFDYGDLVSNEFLHAEAQPQSKLTPHDAFRIMGQPVQRVDIPAKVTGGAAYVQDLRLDGMAHARVVRPPSPSAHLADVDTSGVEAMPGIVKVVRDGDFLAVVAEGEFQAIKAMRALAAAAAWNEEETLPDINKLYQELKALPSEVGVVTATGSDIASGGQIYKARFTRPYQMHGSIGPSCAVAHLDGDQMTIWTHTQGVYPDRQAIAEMLGMPEDKVRCIHAEGAGCYGHNGADDAAADAALVARAVPGRPVRVQWMREQEHAFEPYGPAMIMEVSAVLDGAGKIADWHYDLWSNTHSTRPGGAGALLPARLLASPFQLSTPKLSINPNGSGDRNAIPLYTIPNVHVNWNFMAEMLLRVSALRALGAYANVFSIESFMDDLAAEAGIDPVEFRLNHTDDPRGRDVITMAAEKFGWSGDALPAGRGRGFAFAKYKNHAAYLAVALEAEVDAETGRTRVVRAVAAIDSGEAVNPDGIKNQTEGGIIQSISWTLYEAVTFDKTRITSIDWASYPILRFGGVPDSVDVLVIDRPGEPFLGTGEAAQGPTAAAVGNAIRAATGKRLYDLPLTKERVKAAIGV